jgi:hypothetical protein
MSCHIQLALQSKSNTHPNTASPCCHNNFSSRFVTPFFTIVGSQVLRSSGCLPAEHRTHFNLTCEQKGRKFRASVP